MMERILFIDWGNAARSQMAEAFLKLYGEGAYAVYSAGIQPSGLHPMAVEAMADVDIDISTQTSTSISDLHTTGFDVVITLAEQALQALPQLTYATHHHWQVEDPTAINGDYAEVLTHFHDVRDAIWNMVREWVYNRHHAST